MGLHAQWVITCEWDHTDKVEMKRNEARCERTKMPMSAETEMSAALQQLNEPPLSTRQNQRTAIARDPP